MTLCLAEKDWIGTERLWDTVLWDIGLRAGHEVWLELLGEGELESS